MAKELAIVLNNGSVNSAVVTALAAQKFRPIMLYGELAQPGARSRAAYEQQVTHFKPTREFSVAMSFGTAAPPAAVAPPDPRNPAPVGPQLLDLLPLVAAAARFAVHHQAVAIYLGMRVGPGSEELAQATEYFQIWNELLQLPCGKPELEIFTPLLELEPWQVVDVGYQVGVPFERTWSCTEEGAEPCWGCRGCRQREAAFQQAGKPDPLRVPRRA